MGWNEITATWVQAVGTIAGIFAAVGVGWATLYAERKQTRSRGRVVAFRLAPLLATMHADVERALLAIKELEPGTNDFARASVLIQATILPTQIPDNILTETWSMPPNVALIVAQLENALQQYVNASSQMAMTGSIAAIPQETRMPILAGMKNMLQTIDTYALAASNYCTRVNSGLQPADSQ